MPLIGSSIQEAIDWTQDHLVTTRPLAERTLFSLMADKRVTETAEGYVLIEDGEEEMQKRHRVLKNGYRPRFRFHKSRKLGHKHLKQYLKHLHDQFQRMDRSDDDDVDVDVADDTGEDTKNAVS